MHNEEMQIQEEKRSLWKESNRQGIALLIYKNALSIIVVVIMIVGMITAAVGMSLDAFMASEYVLEGMSASEISIAYTEYLMEKGMSLSSWGYIAAIGLSFILLLAWKRTEYIKTSLFQKNEKMSFNGFFILFAVFMTCQFLTQIACNSVELLLNQFGRSMMTLIEAGSANTMDPVMLLYIGVIAPIAEEVLFRGVMMRGLQSYGKSIAVFASSIMFGAIHGNPVQIPFAILTGIILAYTAMRYDIRWAIALHMANNLVIGILIPMIFSSVPQLGDAVIWSIIVLSTIFTIIASLMQKEKLKEIISEFKTEKWQWKAVFTSPTILIMLAMSLIDAGLLILMLFI